MGLLALQSAFLAVLVVALYLLTRPVERAQGASDEPPAPLRPLREPKIVLVVPLLGEGATGLRRAFSRLASFHYPPHLLRAVAVVDASDRVTKAALAEMGDERPVVEVVEVPSPSSPAWNAVWRAWDANRRAYWWHRGRHAYAVDLPGGRGRLLTYALHELVRRLGDDWLLGVLSTGNDPSEDLLLSAARGIGPFDVLQSARLESRPLESWATSLHAAEVGAWECCVHPHLSTGGDIPFTVHDSGNFFLAADLVAVAGFNPWVTAPEAELGLRLWKSGKRLGVLVDPIEDHGSKQRAAGLRSRARWILGSLEALGQPLRAMGYTFGQRFRARVALLPPLAALVSPLGVGAAVAVFVGFARGATWSTRPLFDLSVASLAAFAAGLVILYRAIWKAYARVLESRSSRLRFLLAASPPALLLWWFGTWLPLAVALARTVRAGRPRQPSPQFVDS